MPLYDSDNGHAVEGKYVKIVQGKELNIRLASEIAASGNLLYPAYQQAMKALQEIVKQTGNFLDELKENNKHSNFYYFTTKLGSKYYEKSYKKGDFLVFGPETRGIPEDILFNNKDYCVTIPMRNITRSLNLSNSVAIGAYGALRDIETDFN